MHCKWDCFSDLVKETDKRLSLRTAMIYSIGFGTLCRNSEVQANQTQQTALWRGVMQHKIQAYLKKHQESFI